MKVKYALIAVKKCPQKNINQTLEPNWPHCVVSLAFAYLVCRNLISESLSELDSKTLGTLGQNHS